jgi:hypothetical protein
MDLSRLISDTLALPKSAIGFHMDKVLAEEFPRKAIYQVGDSYFDIQEFEQDGHCTISLKSTLHSETRRQFDAIGEPIRERLRNVWLDIHWDDQELEIVQLVVPGSHCEEMLTWIIAASMDIAEKFYREVCEWNAEVRGEVLVFENGYWHKSEVLYKAIKAANLSNLVLAGQLKETIVQDFRQFFATREVYEKYGIPWKRGVLFTGPPGNGKTHMIKALVNELNQHCLYVRSLSHSYQTDHTMISEVFQRARQAAPCLLIFEDLDALITDKNRSFFLNELDGFAANTGILTVATTNHPERLDPAILNRPSRFDRKIDFNLPGLTEREAYIRLWSKNLTGELQLEEASIVPLAGVTQGFSFAYIKELFLSSMMQWMSTEPKLPLGEVMMKQAPVLMEQMRNHPLPTPELPTTSSENEDDE